MTNNTNAIDAAYPTRGSATWRNTPRNVESNHYYLGRCVIFGGNGLPHSTFISKTFITMIYRSSCGHLHRSFQFQPTTSFFHLKSFVYSFSFFCSFRCLCRNTLNCWNQAKWQLITLLFFSFFHFNVTSFKPTCVPFIYLSLICEAEKYKDGISI